MKNLDIYKNKKIIITGHTGFKGSWLSLWLNDLGAKVYGISDKILTNPSNFRINSMNIFTESYFFDLKNKDKLKSVIKKIKPDFIFHLAAQALVKKSYDDPYSTFISNSSSLAPKSFLCAIICGPVMKSSSVQSPSALNSLI